MSEWYAVRTAPRQERQAAAVLSERDFTVFLPMAADLRGTPPVKHHEPLMPGYLFVLCDQDHFADIHGLEGIQGFVRYLRYDGAMWPFPFPQSEVLRVQIEERAGVYDFTRDRRTKYRPRKGELVKIGSGPYFGYLAKVLATPKGQRCKLLIEAFGGKRHRTEDVGHLTAA